MSDRARELYEEIKARVRARFHPEPSVVERLGGLVDPVIQERVDDFDLFIENHGIGHSLFAPPPGSTGARR